MVKNEKYILLGTVPTHIIVACDAELFG